MASVRTRILTGFDDPLCGPQRWQHLLHQGDTDVVYLTWHWLSSWWETQGEGRLLLIAAERAGEVVALAPLYTSAGMIRFLGGGESDYLDFIGDVGDPQVLYELLGTARQCVPGFLGFRFYLVPDRSRTGQSLQVAADDLGLDLVLKDECPAVEVNLAEQADAVRVALGGELRRNEEFLRRRGTLNVQHFSDCDVIRLHLDEFFVQHIARWQVKESPSPYANPQKQAFIERFLQVASQTGWIRFLRLEWNSHPLAFTFAWHYQGCFYPGPWCFAIEYARHSPGQVLLRQAVLAALEEGLTTFDLGLGDQAYKLRLPARIKHCNSWGLDLRE